MAAETAASNGRVVITVDGEAIYSSSARHFAGRGDSFHGCRYEDEPWLEREIARLREARER